MDIPTSEEIEELLRTAGELCDKQQWAEAAAKYEQYLAHDPRHELARGNLGFSLVKLGQIDRGVYELQRALAIHPNSGPVLAQLAMAFGDRERRYESIPYRRRLAELYPVDPQHASSLANELLAAGRVAEAITYYRRAIGLAPDYKAAIANYLLALNYSDAMSVEEVACEHFRLAQRWAGKRCRPTAFPQSRSGDRRLRIAYLSADFRLHPVGKIIHPILAGHDRSRFDVIVYHDGAADDKWTALVKERSTGFVPVHRLPDDELLARIRDDRIDLLVEMTGYTGGRNRLEVLAAGAAPLQITFLGYPNTTGHAAVDYLLTDRFCDPPGRTERLHSEKLIRLARGFVGYSPPAVFPPPPPRPRARPGELVLGSFNNPAKVSPTAMKTWARILDALPGSRLKVKYANCFASRWLCDEWRSAFAAAGVDPGRLEFFGATATHLDHLAFLGEVDLALDPFPYQGMMTTLESLAACTPVLTMLGETYCRRASSALLLRLGLEELVTASPDRYVERAVALANHPETLEQMRSWLRENFRASEICDVRGFTAELEATYRDLWTRWCRANPLAGSPVLCRPTGPA